MEFIRDFNELTGSDVALAGGKGASLGEMTRAGFPVPPGFVLLSTAFEAFLARSGLQAAAKSTPDKVGASIVSAPMPVDIEKEIIEAFKHLGADLVAVRSSAAAEDGSTAAWAGQLASYLNTTAADLIQNVKKCWASFFSPRALAYRLDNKLADEEMSLAVVVQKMVAADLAGVAFSAHPVTGDTSQILIEAGCGLGEDLVGGRLAPDSYMVDKSGPRVIESRLSSAGSARLARAAGLSTATASRAEPALKSEDVIDLAGLVIKIEKHWGFPVDVEWAIDGDLFIVQTRPITALPRQAAGAKNVWSNLNIAEVLPGVIPPLVEDMILGLVGPAITKLLKLPPQTELAREIKGRLYFNVTGLQAALARVTGAADLDVTALLGGEQDTSVLLQKAPLAMKVRLARFGAAAFLGSLFIQRRHHRFIIDVRETTAALLRRAEEAGDLAALLDLKDEAMTVTEKFATDSLLMNAFPLSFYMIFSAAAKRWLGPDGGAKGHALLAAGGEGLQEIEALAALWEVRNRIKADPRLTARFLAAPGVPEALASLESEESVQAAYQAFLDTHGHRCAGELDCSVPRWREDPSFIISMLKNYIRAADDADPSSRRRDLQADRAKSVAAVEAELPAWKARVLKRLLALAIDGQKKRENTKSEVVKLLLPLRAILLRIGDLLARDGFLDEAQDVFMLRLTELRNLAAAAAGPSRAFFEPALARKAAYKGYESIELPGVITDLDSLDADLILGKNARQPVPASESDVLSGIGASRGQVEGVARIVESLDHIDRLAPGEILVTDHTDPGWTPVFATIKALITNTGGLISHGAIVAREYGLPAVVNVPNATRLLKSGQHIFVDADNGKIRILPD